MVEKSGKITMGTGSENITPLKINMQCVKTIENHCKEKPTDKTPDLKCVNGVAWNLCPQFEN